MSASEWYMAIGGHQVGPVSADEIVANLRNGTIDAATLVFKQGMTAWTPIRDVPEFRGQAATPSAGALAVPAVPGGRRAHEIGFTIHGEDLQFVEVELDPGESAVAEAGSMMFMTSGIEMETVFGDGSAGDAQGGIMGALLGAGKRLVTGESLFMTVFTNRGPGVHRVAFAAPYAGRIVTLDLAKLGGQLICQKDSFLCAARGVSVGIAFQRKIGVGLFGGEGFIMQKLEGDGLCFAHAGGMVHALDLRGGRGAAGRHRLPGRAAAVGRLRHPVRGQRQDRAFRRRGDLLRGADRPRPRVAAVAPAQPAGRPHLQGGAAAARADAARRAASSTTSAASATIIDGD